MLIKQNEPCQVLIYMVDKNMNPVNNPPNIFILKNGTGFTNVDREIVQISDGMYYMSLLQEDVDTLGMLVVSGRAEGAFPWIEVHQVIATEQKARESEIVEDIKTILKKYGE